MIIQIGTLCHTKYFQLQAFIWAVTADCVCDDVMQHSGKLLTESHVLFLSVSHAIVFGEHGFYCDFLKLVSNLDVI